MLASYVSFGLFCEEFCDNVLLPGPEVAKMSAAEQSERYLKTKRLVRVTLALIWSLCTLVPFYFIADAPGLRDKKGRPINRLENSKPPWCVPRWSVRGGVAVTWPRARRLGFLPRGHPTPAPQVRLGFHRPPRRHLDQHRGHV